MKDMIDIFFFNDTATTEIYTLSLHDALPIYARPLRAKGGVAQIGPRKSAVERFGRSARDAAEERHEGKRDRKSTRLNSSHANISYAVFCLKKKHLLIYYS